MEEKGGHFLTTKSVFLEAMCVDNGNTVIIDELEKLDEKISNEEFLNILYLKMLNRVTGQGDIETWQQAFSMPVSEFRSQAIRTVADSLECKRLGKIIVYNTEGKESHRTISKNDVLAWGYKKVYLKLPNSFKKIIKRVIRRK